MIRASLILLALAGVATPALAQETQASAAAKFKAEFAASDANKDGVLTQNEIESRMGKMVIGGKRTDPVHAKRMAGLWFAAADRDKNGKVTEAEAQALLAATFRKYDANGDGKIGGNERAKAKQELSR